MVKGMFRNNVPKNTQFFKVVRTMAMRQLLIFVFLIIAGFPALTQSRANELSSPVTLSIQIVEPLRGHEGPPGKTRIRLSRNREEPPLFEKTLDGIWENLGYCKKENAYLIGGMFSDGGFLPVRKLALLSVDSRKMATLGFDKGRWSALAGMISPDGEYWVFVGEGVNDLGEEIAPFGLFCLSVEQNKIVRLSDAPAAVPENPPPRTDDSDKEFYWGWGAYCCDGYFKPDCRVMCFANPHILSVDFGYDPVKKHQHKMIVDYDLSKIITK